jgi:hypothetical protein
VATALRRTPPDWWRELRQRERALEQQQEASKQRLLAGDETDFETYLRQEARTALAQLTEQLMTDFRAAGQSEPQARAQAEQMARTHLRHRFRKEHISSAGA